MPDSLPSPDTGTVSDAAVEAAARALHGGDASAWAADTEATREAWRNAARRARPALVAAAVDEARRQQLTELADALTDDVEDHAKKYGPGDRRFRDGVAHARALIWTVRALRSERRGSGQNDG